MTKVFFITDDSEKPLISNATGTLKKHSMTSCFVEKNKDLQASIKDYNPEAIIVDTNYPEGMHECKKIKSMLDKDSIPVILLVDDETPIEILKSANAYVKMTSAADENILAATITAQIKNKKSLNTLTKNNTDLQKSLYQLDALYNTSFQLAGTLDKNKLINIMVEGLEKSLSYSLSYSFIIDSDKEIELIINSLHPLSDRLEKAIRLRAVLSYKALFDKKRLPYDIDIDDINISKIVKHRFNEYDLNIFKYDSLFSPINIGENFFGFIEIFKETDFTQEDATCFQTLTKQVSIPLESALLYEEIKNTNIKLERLERLKSEFISIVSHELRTPLTAIKNSLDILLSGRAGEMTDNGKKFLDNAKRNVVRLSAIINDLLDLSKIEAGKMEFHFEAYNINSSLEFMKNTFTALAAEKEIALAITPLNTDDAKLIYADPVKIEQIFSNLISNAIKFTNADGKITVETKIIDAASINLEKVKNEIKTPPKGNYILISVQDSGIGISDEDKEKVFDEFQQIENHNTRKIGGTGLGLPIARQLTESHLGYIWFDSKIDAGTVFYLALPILNDENVFVLDSLKDLQKAKIQKTPVSFINFKEPLNATSSLINELNAHPEMLTNSANLRTIEYTENSQRSFIARIPDADKYAVDFILKRVEGFLLQKGHTKDSCDIMYSKAVYPDDETDIKKVLIRLDENYKNIL